MPSLSPSQHEGRLHADKCKKLTSPSSLRSRAKTSARSRADGRATGRRGGVLLGEGDEVGLAVGKACEDRRDVRPPWF